MTRLLHLNPEQDIDSDTHDANIDGLLAVLISFSEVEWRASDVTREVYGDRVELRDRYREVSRAHLNWPQWASLEDGPYVIGGEPRNDTFRDHPLGEVGNLYAPWCKYSPSSC